MEEEILEFIHRRFGDTDAHWTNGNCYYFAVILCHRFPCLKIYYEPVAGHFVAGTPSRYYDATGVNMDKEKPILFEELQKNDPLWASRIIRDCIN